LLNELRDRLYELNFDPGPLDGPLTDAARKAIQEFQQQISVPPTGIATMGLLRRLRELGGVKPWASIVYGKDTGKWGMAWNESTRKAAVARARASCGDSSTCPVEVSFFGATCGAFAIRRRAGRLRRAMRSPKPRRMPWRTVASAAIPVRSSRLSAPTAQSGSAPNNQIPRHTVRTSWPTMSRGNRRRR
jgi:hypothetical protein